MAAEAFLAFEDGFRGRAGIRFGEDGDVVAFDPPDGLCPRGEEAGAGEVLDEILSPVKGVLFTLREYPVVDEGSLIARILKAGYQEDVNEN